jgi:hypothetical protein
MRKYIYAIALVLVFGLIGCNNKNRERRNVTRTSPAYLNNGAFLNGCDNQLGTFQDPVTGQNISCQMGQGGFPQFYDPMGQMYPMDPWGATCFSGFDPYTYQCLDYMNPGYMDQFGDPFMFY